MPTKKTPPKTAIKKLVKERASTKGTTKYDLGELELQALEEISKRKLVFMDEVISYLPCSASTFYNYGLESLETLKAALAKNRTDLKAGLRKKWYNSDNATTDIALYKLLGTDEEAHRLNGTRQEVRVDGGVYINVARRKAKFDEDN